MNQRTPPGIDDLFTLAHRLAEAPDRDAAIGAVEDAANRYIGHRLFTVMAFDAGAGEVQRLYSSRPDAYPPGGRKDKRDSAWGRQVLERGEPFIGRNAGDIRQHFEDHAVISGLGLESILNVPIRAAGRTRGTMNLLHEAGYYEEEDVACGRLLAGLLAGVV